MFGFFNGFFLLLMYFCCFFVVVVFCLFCFVLFCCFFLGGGIVSNDPLYISHTVVCLSIILFNIKLRYLSVQEIKH